MPSESRSVAVVTGASGGIGLELSRLLARDGHDLVIVAQHAERLAQAARELRTHGVRVMEVATDLSDPAAPPEIERELNRQGLTPDVLVNNAGFGLQGLFAKIDLGEQLRMIDLNVRALTHLTGLLLPGMLERRRGRVLNVASTAAFQPGPLMAVYYATKAFLLSFSQAIDYELKSSGVTVTVLCPGPTESEFKVRAGSQRSRLFEAFVMDAPRVARAGYDGMMSGKAVAIPGLRNKLIPVAARLIPHDVSRCARLVPRCRNRRTTNSNPTVAALAAPPDR